MAQTIIGIDIGSFSIKIAELKRSFKSFEFNRFFEKKIQYNELLSPEESVSVTLQGMIDDLGLHWDQAICAFPAHKVSSRFLTLPFGNLSKIDQSLEFELEGFVPFDLEQLVIDYHVLNTTKESSDILTFYVLKKDFTEWLQFLQNCHIDPKIITVEGVEFLNLVCLGMIPPEGAYAILDIGHNKTTLSVCLGKKLVLNRAISFGGKQITQMIHQKMGVSLEEAERLKIEMGGISMDDSAGLDDLSAQVHRIIQETFEDWMTQVRQVLFAFQDRAGIPVEGLYLCGGSSRIPRIDRYLSARLKQNVTFIDCTTFHFSNLEKVTAHRSLMPEALSLALRSVAQPGMPALNFRQGEFAFKGDVLKLGSTLKHLGVGLGLIFVMGLTYFFLKYFSLSSKRNVLDQQIISMVSQVMTEVPVEKFSSPETTLRLLKSEESKMTDRIQKLSEIRGMILLKVLKEISEKVPPRGEVNLDVEEMNIKDNKLRVTGTVNQLPVVDRMKAAFENSLYFEKVTPGNVRRVRDEEFRFEMTMDLVKQ